MYYSITWKEGRISLASIPMFLFGFAAYVNWKNETLCDVLASYFSYSSITCVSDLKETDVLMSSSAY
jgi:hypothetical protein